MLISIEASCYLIQNFKVEFRISFKSLLKEIVLLELILINIPIEVLRWL